ncbi:hypothetical protein N9L92_04420 [Saprospiraceae bacterium]|nr:hypothetical protein [Saprospiraceae bacterium]
MNLLLMITLLIGCGKESTNNDQSCQEDGPKKINIRIQNISAFEVVDFNYDNIQTFSSIMPGETTSYMQLETANDVPWRRDMIINGQEYVQQLIDGLGLIALDEGCYTYLHYSVEYGEGELFPGGSVYSNSDLADFDPINEDCVELEKSDCNPDSTKANIRLKNATAFDFCNVDMKLNNQENSIFGNLASGETTCYISIESLKQYPLQCNFILGDEEFIIENPTYHERLEDLSAGFYTYNIYIIGPHNKFGDIQMSID